MKKKWIMTAAIIILAALTGGCQNKSSGSRKTETSDNRQETTDTKQEGVVDLLVWGGEEDEALLQEMFTDFQEAYKDQAEFEITFVAKS